MVRWLHMIYRPRAHPGGVSLDRTVRRREARKHAMVGRVLLAGMESAQPVRLACASAGMCCRLFRSRPLTPGGGIDRRRRIDLFTL